MFTGHEEARDITSPSGCCWAGWPSPPSTLGRGRCYKPRPPALSGWERPVHWLCFLYLGLPRQRQEPSLSCDGLEQELRRERCIHIHQFFLVSSSSPRHLKIKANRPKQHKMVRCRDVNQSFLSNTTYDQKDIWMCFPRSNKCSLKVQAASSKR